MPADIISITRGSSIQELLDSIQDRIQDISQICVSVEYKDKTNDICLSDTMNAYETIGRLYSMIDHVRRAQLEQAE